MITLSSSSGPVEHDPALLAFVKCHVTSFLRWDLLRYLASHPERWIDASDAARELHKPLDLVERGLQDLERETLVEAQRSSDGLVAYRMDPTEPSTRVIERLVAAATRSHQLRELIVARVLRESRIAS